jgi:hypothetical protein
MTLEFPKQRPTREEGRQRLTLSLLTDSMDMLKEKNRVIEDLKADNALLAAQLRLMETRLRKALER